MSEGGKRTEIYYFSGTGNSFLFFLDAVVSGGLLSIGKPMPVAISTMHRITPYLTLFSAAATLYLLLSRR
jgi:hypothetical protein